MEFNIVSIFICNGKGKTENIEDLFDSRGNIRFKDMESAELFASKFPKYCKVKAFKAKDYSDDVRNPVDAFLIEFNFFVSTNKVTGAVNETAEKRNSKIKQILLELLGSN